MSGIPLLLPEMTPCGFGNPTDVCRGDSALSDVSHCCMLWWLSVVPDVPLPLIVLALHHFTCFTVDYLIYLVSL